MLVFGSLDAAWKAGYSVHDRYEDGYVVRTMTPQGWQTALVSYAASELKEHPESIHAHHESEKS